jgi:hypothetical protein
VALGLLALAAAGCATPRVEIVERPGRGPRAEELFIARSFLANGREPNFDEKRIWADRLEDRVSRYLREHRGIEQSPRYSDFRFWHQVSPGALRPEVRALLEEPEEETVDPARMAALAERHWMQIHGRATEAWVYPLGWVIYFDERGVADMVRRVSRVGPPDD